MKIAALALVLAATVTPTFGQERTVTVWETTVGTLSVQSPNATAGGPLKEDVTGSPEADKFLRENFIGSVWGPASLGEVAALVTPSMHAMTEEEKAAREKVSERPSRPAPEPE